MTDVTVHDVFDRLELGACADDRVIDLAHALVGGLWFAHATIDDGDRARFETALIEILTNVVEHAFVVDGSQALSPDVKGRRLALTIGVNDGVILGEVRDNGLPVEIDLSQVGMPDAESESGRGLAMALACLSELSFVRDAGINVWSMRCDPS